jgi:uncharacterized protein (TIGR02301 family)
MQPTWRQKCRLALVGCALLLQLSGAFAQSPRYQPSGPGSRQAPAPSPTPAPAPSNDNRPYDDKLTRLSEILGGIHYLRELCGSNDGQIWRDRMRDLVEAEGSSALRRAKLTKSFNQGYQNYSRTYRTCTATAQTTIGRFLTEAEQLADLLSRTGQ